MKTKLITIKGRKVKCRALKPGELIHEGDIVIPNLKAPRWDEAFYTLCATHEESPVEKKDISLYFRPLKSKPRTAKKREPVIKTIKAWIDEDFLDPNLCPGEGFWRMYSTAHDHWAGRKFIEVTISYRKKK